MNNRDELRTEEQRLIQVRNNNEQLKKDMLNFRKRMSQEIDIDLIPEPLRHLVNQSDSNPRSESIPTTESKCLCGAKHTSNPGWHMRASIMGASIMGVICLGIVFGTITFLATHNEAMKRGIACTVHVGSCSQ